MKLVAILLIVVSALEYNCKYHFFGKISDTHFLYKEETSKEVRWLEKYEYCRARGDVTAYLDASKEKCENSSNLCYWEENVCKNTGRDPDTFEVCESVLYDNILVPGLDSDRLPGIMDKICEAVFIVIFK